MTTLHLGPDSARAHLRDTLVAAIARTPAAAPLDAWTPSSSSPPPALDVVSSISSSKPPPPGSLDWLAHPIPTCDVEHVRSLLALTPATDLSPAAAFRLARALPCFDGDLTAYYLSDAIPSPRRHYELCVAHSLMRLTPDTITHSDFIHAHYPAWRDDARAARTHVLAVLAAHWEHITTALPLPPGLEALPLARSHADADRCLELFLAAASPQHDPTLAPLIEAAAAIMLDLPSPPISSTPALP